MSRWCYQIAVFCLRNFFNNYSILLSDYPWRTAIQPLTSNVIKWFYLPDFAMKPNPSFIFCEHLSSPLFSSHLLSSIANFDFLLFLCCCSLQTTTSCCSAPLCSGRCLRRRTEQQYDCWPETTLRSAAVWILVHSTSSYLSATFFTAGQEYPPFLHIFFTFHILEK